MDFLDKQIAPPKSWDKFEDLTRALFAAIWKDSFAQKNGRTGQPQNGVDVYGTPSQSPGSFHGVQCKGKSIAYNVKATIDEFDIELTKAEGFEPTLAHWTFATTAPNDAPLQEHARKICEDRVRSGKFPVAVIGWETILALLSENRLVVQEFYPEHAGNLADVLAALREFPSAGELADFKKAALTAAKARTVREQDQLWLDVTFDTPRDLGPALMGRPLGPADVEACPVLPEAATLFHDLQRAGSARLAGVAGAGKSICALQTAKMAHLHGWRVVRLANPDVPILPLIEDAQPILHLVDDAHLTQPGLLLRAEQATTSTRWVLSTHTITDQKTMVPGTIQLDSRRAVNVIATGLRKERDRTFRAVRSADDRIGDGPGDERLEDRLAQAEEAEFPWQFCFILGGGWRRAEAIAGSARAAGSDLVLAAAAIRQLATRDARCSQDELTTLLKSVGITADVNAALEWLVTQRLLVNSDDLRCPHQRLAAVLLGRILEGQDTTGRHTIGAMLQAVLADATMPLIGVNVLLDELCRTGEFGRWTHLIKRGSLDPLLVRIWSASEAATIRASCWLLDSIGRFVEDDMALISEHRSIVVGWLNDAAEGTGYALGRLMNHVQNTDPALAGEIVEQVDPAHLANTINQASHGYASELAEMISTMGATQHNAWREKYLKTIDRSSCLRLVGTWPAEIYISAAADFCRHFTYLDTEFGLDLIEALIPAIAHRISDNPVGSFHELDEIVWHSLRLFDPLGIYVGKLAATARMRTVGRQLCARWSTDNLAAKISATPKRNFQSAAGLLSFVRKVTPRSLLRSLIRLIGGRSTRRSVMIGKRQSMMLKCCLASLMDKILRDLKSFR
ncbi:hypothetical protein [Mesorhizobium sp. M2A.F.Ca.ET.043.05.1.1]|uniref:hypothetical protein n=1 Tax=Mesorhizobium sp. M2A.F.Ca.ET.043.05.1.1 TaxID=2493671 RepID=UPI001AECFC47|nr:hypothetical protein [Mesorhizobium sp. M2A.F.Ca.ET.043.05.1.1]